MEAGATLTFPTSQINSTGDITLSGTDGLSLAAGQYLVSFSTDAVLTAAGTFGAALALDGTEVPYSVMSVDTEAAGGERLATTVILQPTAGQILTVINSTDNTLIYDNSVLTVVKIG